MQDEQQRPLGAVPSSQAARGLSAVRSKAVPQRGGDVGGGLRAGQSTCRSTGRSSPGGRTRWWGVPSCSAITVRRLSWRSARSPRADRKRLGVEVGADRDEEREL
ncbi:hypothetical protein GCM10023238_30020 [Streptomyces heliomycini]